MQRLRRVGLLGTLAMLSMAASAQAATVIGPSTSNLPSPATLNASGSGWAPNSTVAISQCTIDLSVCKFLRSAPTDASGNFGPVPVTVTRTFTGDGGTVVDCDTEECAVVYVQGTHTVIGPISFAPPPPAPPPPAPPAQLPPAAGPSPPNQPNPPGVNQTCAGRQATKVGTKGADTIHGTPGRDVIKALGGNDLVYGLQSGDIVCGGGGDDDLRGNAGDDLLRGGRGADTLRGGPGDDTCRGGTGNDAKRSC